jgi:hypothetical protein
MPWYVVAVVVAVAVGVGGVLAGCGGDWEESDKSPFCSEVPPGFQPPPGDQPPPRTSHSVKIVNHAGPDVNVKKQLEDAYVYEFIWQVNFEVEREPGTGAAGWVIQQVDYRFEEAGRDDPLPKSPYHEVYWEAWRVNAGSTEATLEPGTQGEAGGWDDRFWQRSVGTNGWSEIRAIVKFYEGDLPPHFSMWKVPDSFEVYSSEQPPTFWDFSGTCHSWTIEWTGFKKPDNKPFWSYEARMGNLEISGSWSGSW